MPTDTLNFFNQFVEDLAHGEHDLGSDTIKYALCAAANAPVATNSILGDLTEISYTNLTDDGPGSRAITVTTSEGSDGSYELVLADLTITASGGDMAGFRYVVFYNDTPSSPADPLIGWVDYGSDQVVADGETYLFNFGANVITLTTA